MKKPEQDRTCTTNQDFLKRLLADYQSFKLTLINRLDQYLNDFVTEYFDRNQITNEDVADLVIKKILENDHDQTDSDQEEIYSEIYQDDHDEDDFDHHWRT